MLPEQVKKEKETLWRVIMCCNSDFFVSYFSCCFTLYMISVQVRSWRWWIAGLCDDEHFAGAALVLRDVDLCEPQKLRAIFTYDW